MAEDCRVNFPIAGLLARLQELTVYGVCEKNPTKSLILASPKIQVCSRPPHSTKET
jgi:hypothetical protein